MTSFIQQTTPVLKNLLDQTQSIFGHLLIPHAGVDHLQGNPLIVSDDHSPQVDPLLPVKEWESACQLACGVWQEGEGKTAAKPGLDPVKVRTNTVSGAAIDTAVTARELFAEGGEAGEEGIGVIFPVRGVEDENLESVNYKS